MPSSLRWLDISVIAVYMVGVMLVGRWFSRRQTSTESYFIARRSIPNWAMGITIYAALVTSIAFIAFPGSAYAGNWNELAQGFMVLGVLILVGLVIIPFYRHAVGMSLYEYFENRFSYKIRAYAAFAFTMGHFAKMGFVFYTLALTISSITGWNIYIIMVGTGVVTVYYTLIGGMEAVVWTDVIQGCIKTIGIFVCLGTLACLMPGGLSAAFHLAADAHKFSLGSANFDFRSKTNLWVMLLYGFSWFMQKYTADQTMVQRYLVARSDREALQGVAFGALLCVPAWALFMLIGTLTWAYYQLSHEVLPAFVDKADKVFPYFLTTKVPAGLAGLFMASLFSAAMGMLSSDLNCLSLVMVEDFYRKARPQSTDRQRLILGKIIIAICGTLSVLVGVIIAWKSERVLSLFYTVTSIVAGGLAGLFLLGFLSPRANRQGAYVGIAACLLFTAYATFSSGRDHAWDFGRWNFPWNAVLIGPIGQLVVFIVGYVASFAFASSALAKRSMTFWGWRERQAAIATAAATAG